IADEADGVGKQDFAAAGQLDSAKLWIQRGENARRRKHLRTGETIEQGTFASVGIADKRDCRHWNRFAALALLAANATDIFDTELEMIDTALDPAPVGFKLGFPWAGGAYATTELRHGFASPCQPRKHVFKLRKLHL